MTVERWVERFLGRMGTGSSSQLVVRSPPLPAFSTRIPLTTFELQYMVFLS
jgi:hypothetical protein